MLCSPVSYENWKESLRFSDPPHNSASSDMLDVLSCWCRHITRKSTWIFKIWLRFVKYWSSLSREWNLHEYGPVVAKLEQFEVELPKTWPPLHSGNMTPTHRGWNGGLEWSIDFGPKYKWKISSFGGHLCRNREHHFLWKWLRKKIDKGSFFFREKKRVSEDRGPAILSHNRVPCL